MGHRPIYNSKHHDADGNPTLDALYLQVRSRSCACRHCGLLCHRVNPCRGVQQAIENLLHKYSVDMYVSGHRHEYYRCYPVYNNQVCV